MAGDTIVGGNNCTATPDNVACVINDVGEGLGEIFGDIDTPLGTLLIVVGVAGGVVAILYGLSKVLTNKIRM